MAELNPIVDGNIRGSIVLHPDHELQLDPGGATITFDRPVTLKELMAHPLIEDLMYSGWKANQLVGIDTPDGLPSDDLDNTAMTWTLICPKFNYFSETDKSVSEDISE